MTRSWAALVIAAGCLVYGSAQAQMMAPDDRGNSVMGNGKRVLITYENLTAGQVLSPSVFFSHNASAPKLFEVGKPASFYLMRIAEEGNAGPLLSAVVTHAIGGAYGSVITAAATQPGKSRTVVLEVDPQHPMISGAFMLVMTNDGFAGVNGMNAYGLDHPVSMDLYAYDAGTERDNEQGPYLIAMQGTERDPEHGVVLRHAGIRGDADAPGIWKFDPRRPVARITIAPAPAQ